MPPVRDITPQQAIEGVRRITVEDWGVGELIRIQLHNGFTVVIDALELVAPESGQVSVHKPGFTPEEADGMVAGVSFCPAQPTELAAYLDSSIRLYP